MFDCCGYLLGKSYPEFQLLIFEHYPDLGLGKVSTAPAGRKDRFRLTGTNLCINVPNAVAVEGEALQLFACGSPFFDNEVFSTTTRGEIKTLGSAKCLTVSPNDPTSGNLVVSSTCNSGSTANRNQQFSVGLRPVKWAGDNGQCMDIENGVSINGARVQLHACVAGAMNEVWDYYF